MHRGRWKVRPGLWSVMIDVSCTSRPPGSRSEKEKGTFLAANGLRDGQYDELNGFEEEMSLSESRLKSYRDCDATPAWTVLKRIQVPTSSNIEYWILNWILTIDANWSLSHFANSIKRMIVSHGSYRVDEHGSLNLKRCVLSAHYFSPKIPTATRILLCVASISRSHHINTVPENCKLVDTGQFLSVSITLLPTLLYILVMFLFADFLGNWFLVINYTW